MSERQATRRVPSESVQGEGSFVVFAKMKWGEAKKIRAQAKDPEVDETEFMQDCLVKYIKDWDWVDDDGNRLPVPKDDPGVIDELTAQEIKFLSEAFKDPPEEELKN